MNGQAGCVIPEIIEWVDYESNELITSETAMFRYDTHRCHLNGRRFSRKFTPSSAVVTDIEQDPTTKAISVKYGVSFKRWLDMTDTNIPHLSWKFHAHGGTTNWAARIKCTMYVSLKRKH